MKRILLCTMSILTTVLSSCGLGNDEYKTTDEIVSELLTNILVCFENNDKEILKTYFIESERKYKSIDAEIDEAFEFIDGKIVSYGELLPSCIRPAEDRAYGGAIYDIITDKGTEYKIDFKGKYRCDADKSKEGVRAICIINMTETDKLPEDAFKSLYS